MDMQKKQRIHELRQRLQASRQGRQERGQHQLAAGHRDGRNGEEEDQADDEPEIRGKGREEEETRAPQRREEEEETVRHRQELPVSPRDARNQRSLFLLEKQKQQQQLVLDAQLFASCQTSGQQTSESDKKRKLQVRAGDDKQEREAVKPPASLPRCLGHVAGHKALVCYVGTARSQRKEITLPTTRGELLALATTALRLRPPAQRVFDALSGVELLDPWLQELQEPLSMRRDKSWGGELMCEDAEFVLAVSQHEDFARPSLAPPPPPPPPPHAALESHSPPATGREEGNIELEERLRQLEVERAKLKKQLEFKGRALAASIRREREGQEREETLKLTRAKTDSREANTLRKEEEGRGARERDRGEGCAYEVASLRLASSKTTETEEKEGSLRPLTTTSSLLSPRSARRPTASTSSSVRLRYRSAMLSIERQDLGSDPRDWTPSMRLVLLHLLHRRPTRSLELLPAEALGHKLLQHCKHALDRLVHTIRKGGERDGEEAVGEVEEGFPGEADRVNEAVSLADLVVEAVVEHVHHKVQTTTSVHSPMLLPPRLPPPPLLLLLLLLLLLIGAVAPAVEGAEAQTNERPLRVVRDVNLCCLRPDDRGGGEAGGAVLGGEGSSSLEGAEVAQHVVEQGVSGEVAGDDDLEVGWVELAQEALAEVGEGQGGGVGGGDKEAEGVAGVDGSVDEELHHCSSHQNLQVLLHRLPPQLQLPPRPPQRALLARKVSQQQVRHLQRSA
eukprot:750295-Hanusia_phi.AAC.1